MSVTLSIPNTTYTSPTIRIEREERGDQIKIKVFAGKPTGLVLVWEGTISEWSEAIAHASVRSIKGETTS